MVQKEYSRSICLWLLRLQSIIKDLLEWFLFSTNISGFKNCSKPKYFNVCSSLTWIGTNGNFEATLFKVKCGIFNFTPLFVNDCKMFRMFWRSVMEDTGQQWKRVYRSFSLTSVCLLSDWSLSLLVLLIYWCKFWGV